MSDSQAYEKVTLSSHGVTVTKRFEEAEFPVPAIAFEFESERDEEVTATLTDTVPEGVEVEDLGFHPEYGSEYWTIDDDVITFERDIDAGGDYTTVYGIRATGTDDVEQFLTEPSIEEIDPPLPESEQENDAGGDIIPESGDDVVKDAIAGDGEIPGLEDDGDEVSDEGVEKLDLKDPNQEGVEATTDNEGDGEVAVSGSSLVNALANEIRQGNVSADDVKLLRRAFEVAGDQGGSTTAKVEQLQSDIADLRAYTGALEEFLEENGTGAELIHDVDNKVESLESSIDDLSSQVEGATTHVTSLSEDINEIESAVESNSTNLEQVSDDVAEFETSIDSLQDSVAELEEQLTDGEVADRVEDIESELKDLKSWQDQIKETFGGA